MHGVIAGIIDEDSSLKFIKLCRKYYCGLCQIRRKKHWYCGKPAPVLGRSFDVNSSKKAARFTVLRLFQHPFVGLVDTRFLPGTDQEWHGLSFMVLCFMLQAKLPFLELPLSRVKPVVLMM
jgi:acetyl-CoA carboxylase carboxyltransferase component